MAHAGPSEASGNAARKNGGHHTANGGVRADALGRLAPAVSVGDNPMDRGAASGAGDGNNRFGYDIENGPSGGAGGMMDDVVEHDYGDTGQAEVRRVVYTGILLSILLLCSNIYLEVYMNNLNVNIYSVYIILYYIIRSMYVY